MFTHTLHRAGDAVCLHLTGELDDHGDGLVVSASSEDATLHLLGCFNVVALDAPLDYLPDSHSAGFAIRRSGWLPGRCASRYYGGSGWVRTRGLDSVDPWGEAQLLGQQFDVDADG